MSATDYILRDEGVLFDPGYGVCLGEGYSDLDYVFNAFGSIPSPKQRKMQFMRLYPQITSTIEQDAAFYLGCLLWASCLKCIGDKPVLNNPCLGAEYSGESLQQIDFMLDLVSGKLNRDAKYYLNKSYEAPEYFAKILQAYKEFYALNQGFINTKRTDDIQLPASLKKLSGDDLEKAVQCIQSAIGAKNIKSLLAFADLIL